MQATAARQAVVAAFALRPAAALAGRRLGACSIPASRARHQLPAASSRHARHVVLAAAAAPAAEQQPGAAAAAAAAEQQPGAEAADAKRAGKRKVALFMGYEGTEFRGLQIQPSSAPEATVEDALEEAIFKAGGILPSNRGQLSKIAWSRSSRTDKSVHSLATVVALKMEVEDVEGFEADPEGQALAAAINTHLPPEVRVFSIQRVNKSFNARGECIRRTYNYYLPASALGLALDGGEADAARLALLQQAWERFQGTHPFHNYTKRRLYREAEGGGGGSGGGRGGGARRWRSRAEQDSISASSGSDAEEAEGEGSDAEAEAVAAAEAPSSSGGDEASAAGSSSSSSLSSSAAVDSSEAAAASASSSSSSDAVGCSGEPAAAEQGEERWKKGRVQLVWKHDRDTSDLVVRRHFRFIEWCKADTEAKPLVPGGEPCVLLSLQGGSFMLHQIRHMVAMAVAVARGHLPLELLEASLATPSRLNLPMAPPSTLMLMGAQFSPFKRSWSGQAALAAQWSGDTLELREQGTAAQQAFLQQTMLPALDSLLAGDEWRQWERDLEGLWYDEGDLAMMLEAHVAWKEARRASRLEAMLEEAAALENAREE